MQQTFFWNSDGLFWRRIYASFDFSELRFGNKNDQKNYKITAHFCHRKYQSTIYGNNCSVVTLSATLTAVVGHKTH